MLNKNRRVLWLLNHRTLMQYEVPLVRRLGFEVYVPKVIPQFGFRSGTVDLSYDSDLSIPKSALDTLNRFNFYESEWTTDVTRVVNRYFGTLIFIPHGQLTAQAVDNFEGQLILRAFGLNNEYTYAEYLEDLHGPLVLRKLKGVRERFWFGEGYEHLHECEESFFGERALFLPIGVPDQVFRHAGTWVGTDRRILFLCPNAASDPHFSTEYRRFKEDFGDLPHVIIGAQDVQMDDPHVLGFVPDEVLQRLYRECAVMYYHSNQVRHVHYSPIEAAITGMPLVFHRGSLLDRLSGGEATGGVDDSREARRLVERLLSGDAALAQRVVHDQRRVADYFRDELCSPQWRRSIEERGLMDVLDGSSRIGFLLTEIRRTVLLPWAHGRTRIEPHRTAVRPPKATMTAAEAKTTLGSSLYDGIVFSERRPPSAVEYIAGVGPAEPRGRWTNDRTVQIVLRHVLSGEFRLFVRAVAYGPNVDEPIKVSIADVTRDLRLTADADRPTAAFLQFTLDRPTNVIEIRTPHLVKPPTDTRAIGIALMELRAVEPVTATADEAHMSCGSSLLEGIDFRADALPPFVEAVSGLGEPEGTGRWSIGERVRFELAHVLRGRFRLVIEGGSFGPNADTGVFVVIGEQRRRLDLPSEFSPGGTASADFDLEAPTNVIEFEVPHPTRPEGDDRLIGIGFVRVHVEQAP